MRGWRQKFHADSLPAISRFSHENHAAFLFFQRLRMNQHQHLAIIHFIAQHQQSAMRVHHLRFAHFAKFPAIVAAPNSLQPHPVKDALASAGRGLQNFAHEPMVMGEP